MSPSRSRTGAADVGDLLLVVALVVILTILLIIFPFFAAFLVPPVGIVVLYYTIKFAVKAALNESKIRIERETGPSEPEPRKD